MENFGQINGTTWYDNIIMHQCNIIYKKILCLH